MICVRRWSRSITLGAELKRLVVLTALILVGCSADIESPDVGSPKEPLDENTTTLTVAKEHPEGYDRDLFGDYDRHDILVRNHNAYHCEGYYSLANDVCHLENTDVEVGHMVSLAEAWRSGAYEWSDEQLRKFGSDANNLWLMTTSLNRQKSDSDIAEWLPPNDGAVCIYARRYLTIKYKWELTVDQAEMTAILNILDRCES